MSSRYWPVGLFMYLLVLLTSVMRPCKVKKILFFFFTFYFYFFMKGNNSEELVVVLSMFGRSQWCSHLIVDFSLGDAVL